MKDTSGNELPKNYENSFAARCYQMDDTLRRADMLLAKAVLNQHNTTKQDMVKAMNEASEMIHEVIGELTGGR